MTNNNQIDKSNAEIFLQRVNAFLHNVPLTYNPYPPDSAEAYWWADGWVDESVH